MSINCGWASSCDKASTGCLSSCPYGRSDPTRLITSQATRVIYAIDPRDAEISRLQAENAKLREALIDERARRIFPPMLAQYAIDKAEQELRAEGLIE